MLSQEEAFAQQLREAEAYLQLRADEEDSLDKVLQAVQRTVQVHRAASPTAMQCLDYWDTKTHAALFSCCTCLCGLASSSHAGQLVTASVLGRGQCTTSAQLECMPDISCDAGERGR